jgi:hypothetical protein
MLPGEGGGAAADAGVEDWVGECGQRERERESVGNSAIYLFFFRSV